MTKLNLFGRTLKLVIAGGLALAGTSCWASVIYTNLGAGDTFNTTNGYYVGGPTAQMITAHFAPSAAANFGSLRLAVDHVMGANGVYSVTLAANANGLPGAAIESFTGLSFPPTAALFTIDSVTNPLLDANTTYWIVISSVGPLGFWFDNSQGATGLGFKDSSYPNWMMNPNSMAPAFEVTSYVAESTIIPEVPEPGTIGLMLCGAALLLRKQLRRR